MSILSQKILAVILWVVFMVIWWRILRYVVYNWIPDEIGVWLAFAALACLPIGIVMLILDKRRTRRRATGARQEFDHLG